MSRLEEQLEELEVLQAIEFEIEDRSSYDKAVRYVKKLSLEPPKILCLLQTEASS